MPKILIGCLIVLAVVVIGGGTAGYFFVVKPGYDFVTGAQAMVEEFAELNEQVEHRDDYRPPADGAISEEQFARYRAAQVDMRTTMEGKMSELQQQFEEMQAEIDAEDRDANLREMASAYRGLADLLLEAKRAQVEALNAHDFSLDEYHYVRNQVYRALGQSVAVASFGGSEGVSRRVPDEVVEMIEPHREELMESYSLAWFGL